MARRRMENEFAEFLKNLDGEKLKRLIAEAQSALANYERENSLSRKKDKAIALRNNLHIGATAYFIVKKSIFVGNVLAIMAETVKVEKKDGTKKTFKVMQLISENDAKAKIAAGDATIAYMTSNETTTPEENNASVETPTPEETTEASPEQNANEVQEEVPFYGNLL